MDSRRLVVWISTGILGVHGATLAFDLLNCTALSWLHGWMNGLLAIEQRVDSSGGSTQEHPVALFCARPQGRSILAELALGSSVDGRGIDER